MSGTQQMTADEQQKWLGAVLSAALSAAPTIIQAFQRNKDFVMPSAGAGSSAPVSTGGGAAGMSADEQQKWLGAVLSAALSAAPTIIQAFQRNKDLAMPGFAANETGRFGAAAA